MTSSNGNIFRVTGPLCGEFTGPGEFPTQRPVTRSFDVFFDLRLNKPLSKQPWGWWFETLSRSLWRHRNGTDKFGFGMDPVACFLRFYLYIQASYRMLPVIYLEKNDREILRVHVTICFTNSVMSTQGTVWSEPWMCEYQLSALFMLDWTLRVPSSL